MATTVTSNDSSVEVEVANSGILVHLGQLESGISKEFGIWLVTASGREDRVRYSVIDRLEDWAKRDINQVANESRSSLPEPLIQRMDKSEAPFTTIIQSTGSLARATQAASGCVLAQPYM
ncbi:MAG: hypothetical protein GVY20_02915 [Bacteroidetes bacterium]|nr:hypothetical protein [Bacteroidota bacterium]